MSIIAYMSAPLCLRLRLDTEHGISNSQLRKWLFSPQTFSSLPRWVCPGPGLGPGCRCQRHYRAVARLHATNIFGISKYFFWFSRASLNTKRPFMQWRVERHRPRASQLMLLIKLRFYNWIITNSIRSHEHSRNFWPAIILPDIVNYTIYLAHKVSRNVLPTNCTTYAGCVCHRSHHGAWTGQNKTKD